MDFPDAKPLPARPAWERAAARAAVLALAIYAFVLVRHVGAVAASSDSSGYMNHAKLFMRHRLHIMPRVIPGLPAEGVPPYLYVPLGFKPAWNGEGLVPTYPTGFPLLVLAAVPFAGWRYAGDLAIIVNSLAGLAATYLLGRALGLGRPWSLVGAAILALSPLYLFMSVQAMSDVPSLVWTTLAVLAALRSRKKDSWAVAAGAAIAIDVLLRPTNVLAFVPVLTALGASRRRWVLFGLGGVPGAVFFCVHSLDAYGSLLATGYGDNTVDFGAAYVAPTLKHYAYWLPLLLTPVVVLNLGLPWMRGERALSRWLIGVWILVFAVFFSTYKCTHETWWYLRFLLPAVPALIVGGLLGARALLKRAPAWADPGRTPAAFAAVILLVIADLGPRIRDRSPLLAGADELKYMHVTDWMKDHVPADAVCLSMQETGSLIYYTSFRFVRWDVLNPGNVSQVESAIRAAGLPLYAVLFPFEIEQGALATHMPGRWTEVGKVEDVTIFRRDFGASHP
jgi:hypothetical protein